MSREHWHEGLPSPAGAESSPMATSVGKYSAKGYVSRRGQSRGGKGVFHDWGGRGQFKPGAPWEASAVS